MNKKHKYIFLDFDGVINLNLPNSHMFELMPLFCNVLRKHKNIARVVISSSWRIEQPLSFLKYKFEEDVRELVVGVTPVHVDGMSDGGREREILDFIKTHCLEKSSWVAIDDNDFLFSSANPNLILCHKKIGFDDFAIKLLNAFLTKT